MITISYVLPSNYRLSNLITFTGPMGGMGVQVYFGEARGSYELGSAPSNGPRLPFGDKACYHNNIRGSLIYKDPLTAAGTINYGSSGWTPKVVANGLFSGIPYFRVGLGKTIFPGPYVKTNGIYWTDTVTNFTIEVSNVNGHLNVDVSWHFRRDSTYSSSYRRNEDRLEYIRWSSGNQIPMSGSSDTSVTATWTKRDPYSQVTPTTGSGSVSLKRIGTLGSEEEACRAFVSTKVWWLTGLLGGDLPAYPANFQSGVKLAAVESCRVIKINMLAFGKDITSLHTVATWAKNLGKISKLKDVASAYLGYKYGAPLTAQDIVKLTSSLSKIGRHRSWKKLSIARSRDTFSAPSAAFPSCTWKREYNAKLYYIPKDTAGDNALRGLSDYGVFPSRRNLWDMIPLSFTLDWVVNVSDYLRTADAKDYLHTVNVHGFTASTRDSITIPGKLISSSLGGEVEQIFYARHCNTSLSLDDPSFQLQNPSNHLLEGGALIAVRTKF